MTCSFFFFFPILTEIHAGGEDLDIILLCASTMSRGNRCTSLKGKDGLACGAFANYDL